MIEKTIQLKIDTCLEETAPPVTLKVEGNDGSVIFWAEMVDPTWAGYQNALHGAAEKDPYEVAALLVAACVDKWSVDLPVEPASVRKLHPQIQEALATCAMEFTNIKTAQAKNSEPLLTSSGTQQSKPIAAKVTGK